MKPTKPKKKVPRGRQGGRKSFLLNPSVKKAYLDQETIDFYTALGKGNYSAGLRTGRALLEHFQSLKKQTLDLIKEELV